MGTAIKRLVPDWAKPSFVIFFTSGHSDSLTQSGAGCFIAVPIWQQWASKDLLYLNSSSDVVDRRLRRGVSWRRVISSCIGND